MKSFCLKQRHSVYIPKRDNSQHEYAWHFGFNIREGFLNLKMGQDEQELPGVSGKAVTVAASASFILMFVPLP
jgi:hypothetical protein